MLVLDSLINSITRSLPKLMVQSACLALIAMELVEHSALQIIQIRAVCHHLRVCVLVRRCNIWQVIVFTTITSANAATTPPHRATVSAYGISIQTITYAATPPTNTPVPMPFRFEHAISKMPMTTTAPKRISNTALLTSSSRNRIPRIWLITTYPQIASIMLYLHLSLCYFICSRRVCCLRIHNYIISFFPLYVNFNIANIKIQLK